MVHGAVEQSFLDVEVPELQLENSPLARVLAQLRFPSLVVLNKNVMDETLAPILRELGREYPINERGAEHQVEVGPQGVRQTEVGVLVHVVSADSAWKVTFGNSFIALESSAYKSRTDFIERFDRVFRVFSRYVDIPRYDRIGFRYTNRVVDGAQLTRLGELVRPEVLGVYSPILEGGAVPLHSVGETILAKGSTMLGVRTAFLPPLGTVDPSLPPVDSSSWTFDLDSYEERVQVLSAAETVAEVARLAEFAHRFFRWAVTDKFLAAFGVRL